MGGILRPPKPRKPRLDIPAAPPRPSQTADRIYRRRDDDDDELEGGLSIPSSPRNVSVTGGFSGLNIPNFSSR